MSALGMVVIPDLLAQPAKVGRVLAVVDFPAPAARGVCRQFIVVPTIPVPNNASDATGRGSVKQRMYRRLRVTFGGDSIFPDNQWQPLAGYLIEEVCHLRIAIVPHIVGVDAEHKITVTF